tara:strand:- start:2100 stop:3164 length:1065 start_codon:yes stop_codon:yes gene_type:complete
LTNWEFPVDVNATDNCTKNCPIQLGQVFCDGFHKNGSIGVFTHFHQDHIGAIKNCIGQYDKLIVHPITFAAIVAMDKGMKLREQWVTQDRTATFPSKVGTISLLDANHIPGSCQVHVQTDDYSMLYSGDFNFPEMQIKQADYLVLDASHGNIHYDAKSDRKSVMNRLFEDVKEKVDNNRPIVIIVPAGTLQELIKNIELGHSEHISHDIPFVADKKQIAILNSIYEAEKSEFRDLIEFDERDFWKLQRKNSRMVIFLTSLNEVPEELSNYYRIIVGRYRFTETEPAIRVMSNGKGCRYNLESHATIENIYSYVEEVKPKVVITDSSRSDYASTLAKLIKQKFDGKIKTFSRPRN